VASVQWQPPDTRGVIAARAAPGAGRSTLNEAIHSGPNIAITLHPVEDSGPETTMTLESAARWIRLLSLCGLGFAVACESDLTGPGPGRPKFVLLTPGTVSQVSAGGHHSCAVRTNGTVACWGDDYDGEVTPPAGAFTQVSAGGFAHTCGLRTDGTVDCWGNNAEGQATSPAGTFSQVSAGYVHTCGLKTDGTLACWGDNYFGQATPPTGAFTEVSAGYELSCGLKADSTLACWGRNSFGGATPPTGTFSQVSAGVYYGCGLKTDGTVACWGLNDSGQATPPAGTFTQVSAGMTTLAASGPTASSPVGARTGRARRRPPQARSPK